MHENRLNRPGTGRGRGQQPPPPPYPPPLQQPQPPPPGVNTNPNFIFQDPNLLLQSLLVNSLLQNYTPQHQQNQNFNFIPQQNPIYQFQSPNYATQQVPPQQTGSSGQQVPPPQTGSSGQQLPPPQTGTSGQQAPWPQQTGINGQKVARPPKGNKKEMLESVERAVEKAWRMCIEDGESVYAWRVSQAALEMLEVDSWGSLGFKMQEVPSLHRIIVTEGKINSFINCFVGVRRITTLYDLEVAICKNEGIEKFEELELGPFLKHPLVLHYFSVNSVREVFKLTSEEVVLFLSDFVDARKKKEISADEFLEFIASKRSVEQKEMLGVRIQSLGMHISFIQEAKGSEKETLKSCRPKLERKSIDSSRSPPHIASQKKVLDERFSSISERVESFSSVHKKFRGKHTRFVYPTSEDEDSDDKSSPYEDAIISNNSSIAMSPLQNAYGAERVSGCPYPSLSEEKSRLGLKNEMSSQKPLSSGSSMKEVSDRLFKRKRKRDSNPFLPSKLLESKTGAQKSHQTARSNKSEEIDTSGEEDISLSDSSMNIFITTWKEACKAKTVRKVLEKMIRFYHPKGSSSSSHRKQIRSMFSMHPCIELLNVAVTSIKCGMWDSIYDAFQAINQNEPTNINSSEYSEFEMIDVEPTEKPIAVIPKRSAKKTSSVTIEDIIGRFTRYYELYPEVQSNGRSLHNNFTSLRKLYNCESWLIDQFGVKEFTSLGHGDFLCFIEKHVKLLPRVLQNIWACGTSEKSTLEVCILQHQLIALVSQASNSLWESESITKQMISALLVRQFPLLSFRVMENDSMEDFLEIVKKNRNEVIAKSVIFSASLQEDLLFSGNDNTLVLTPTNKSLDLISTRGTVSHKDAIDVLTAAPMLSDLKVWSHWDQIFAPSFGPLVEWLLTEVNSKDLLCLVTKDCKVIRIDPFATAELFLSAALQRSAFQTAVNLVSLFSLTGGEKHAPLSLLKCYALRAFEVLLSDHHDVEVEDGKDSSSHEMVVDVDSDGKVKTDSTRLNDAVRATSRFVIDSVRFLPSEFRGFATDIFLHGMQSVMRAAPSSILCVCNQEERIMFHEIGLSMGILEWIGDYHIFCSNWETRSISTGPASLEATQSSLHVGSTYIPNTVDIFSYADAEPIASHKRDAHDEKCSEAGRTINGASISNNRIGHNRGELPDDSHCEDAVRFIESIRRDEFGLDPSLSISESSMLKKQHARLGRALHCLSQELYSQDSHFILELVQNADDNIYPENEEPTLTFILQESGIIILNNEQGFSAENIRALCDVGNSTKKGTDAGYIGQKGIGFKSVFRVTDAPEIHSRGFHIKFDISEGQIGFVLPTIVPPCNIRFFDRLLSGDNEQMNKKCWNTCIVLPFRPTFSGETALNMFSDLHPSLLLFLHRLECIVFRNMLNDSLVVMKKETLPDGIVKVSCGKEQMTWLVASQKLRGHASRPKVQTTEIAIAFTLEESDNGLYIPRLDQQPVFSFLPLRTYGLKFILQGDFVLPSSREEVDKNNPWNEWLLMKLPALFVSAEKHFCALPCFRENPGKAVAAFMSFVPLVGEVHGFFSGLPKAIILELRRTECLLLEGDDSKMVPPCSVLRGWNETARNLLPDDFLQEHLGLGFLDKNIVLSDPLARALGIVEYGPEILVRFMICLCNTVNGLELMGLGWLSSWLDSLYAMLSNSSESANLIERLKNISFIPLSDGTYSSVDLDTIWLPSDVKSSTTGLEAFPNLYAKLRTVNPFLLSVSSDRAVMDNITGMLHRIGVQELSAHEIMKVHILPAICDGKSEHMDKGLLTDYLCFVMIHLQSSCHGCYTEKKFMISELRSKAYILTNHGCKRLIETPIHFSREFGNPIDVNKLVDSLDMTWLEVDINYLKHPANEALSNRLAKWREFFQEIGVRNFVQVIQIEKTCSDLSRTVLKNPTWNWDLVSSGMVAKDWESPELMSLLSLLSKSGDRESCKLLLEMLDTLWNDEFSDKVTGYFSVNGDSDVRFFTSSFVYNICDVQWVVSSIDNRLHFPKKLFYDCDTVRSILGASAPYALPKIKSEKLVKDIGFKTTVALDDVIEILRTWREGGTAIEASIAQMTKCYMLMWDEMAVSRNKILEATQSGPFVFVPSRRGSRQADLVPGFFFTLEEVYWEDPTGSVEQLKRIRPKCSVTANERPMSKALCNIYPGLHDFFKECGVPDFPSSCAYLDILQQLSTVVLPSQSARMVFQVFLRWADQLKSGLLSSDDITHLKECLLKLEYAVLPTVQDKWVSLHPSFGLVCWSDDKKLAKRCENMNNIDFLFFGDLEDHEQEILRTKMSALFQNLGIPAFSEVVTREAIYYGLSERRAKVSLINWALPFVQRYIHCTHPEKYNQLKRSGFNSLKQLILVVVEKLFYVNVIKGVGVVSEKRFECSCLLQGNTLYATEGSDPHTLFLELSRLFFDGSSNLQMANFLHLITTMTESGSTEEQTESFIVNSQNVTKLPDEESVWRLSLERSTFLAEDGRLLETSVHSAGTEDEKVSKSKEKAGVSSNWPPADWKTAPDLNYAHAPGLKTQPAALYSNRSDNLEEGSSMENMTERNSMLSLEIVNTVLPDSETEEMENHDFTSSQILDIAVKPGEFQFVSDGLEVYPSRFSRRDQLNTGTVNTELAMRNGRLGEQIAFNYFSDRYGTNVVQWVNEDCESGLPYDIVVEEEEGVREYFEVKATSSARKDWFNISIREWQFAVEKGDSFNVAHVRLPFGNNAAKVTTFKNPVKQCQQGKLQLVVLMPRKQDSSAFLKESSISSN